MQATDLIALLISLAAFLVSVYNLAINLHRQWLMKQIDVRMECQRRFDSILEDMANAPEDHIHVKSLYLRYWELQLVQFNCWMEKLLRDDTYMYWMSRRFLEYHVNLSIGGIDYREGWAYAKKMLYDKNFIKFIDLVLEGRPSDAYDFGKKLTGRERRFRIDDYQHQFEETKKELTASRQM